MENIFADKMSKNTDQELFEIYEKRSTYEDEACLAAIEELEKRNLANAEMLELKAGLIEKITEKQKEAEEKKVERKKAFEEAIELLKPSRDYFYTPIILYLNVLIFIIMAVSGVHPFEPSVESLLQWGGNLRSFTLEGQPWRLLTSMFLHGGVIHLLLNMYAFIYVGGLLETQFGKHRFFLVYILTGIIASLASISINWNIVSVGASGAIFGIYGLFLSLLVTKSYKIPEESRQNLLSSTLIFIGYNLVFGFAKEGIDNAAHIGGLVSGFIIGLAYYPSTREPRYSKIISGVLVLITLGAILIAPKVISNPGGKFQQAMEVFSQNEEKAMWIYKEEMQDTTLELKQKLYDRLDKEGIQLWDQNLKILDSLNNLPQFYKERVDILTEYCKIRKETFRTIQRLVKDNRPADQEMLDQLNSKLEAIMKKMEERFK